MKKIYLLPVILCITSCSSYFSRSFTEGNVYNYKTKRAIENAIVFVKSNNEYIEETKTSSNGGFSFEAKKHFKIGYDSRDLSTKSEKSASLSGDIVCFIKKDKCKNKVLLTIGTMLYRRSLELELFEGVYSYG